MKKTKLSLDERLAARRKQLSERGSGGGNWHFLKDGKSRIRVIPTLNPDDDWSAEVQTFFINNTTVISPNSFGEPCAIMETYNKLSGSKKEKDNNLAKKFRPKKKFLVVTIKYTDDKGREVDQNGIRAIALPNAAYTDMLDMYLDKDESGDFTDPIRGYDILISRTGKGMLDTEYSAVKRNSTKLGKAFRKEKIDPMEYAKGMTPTYEETEAIIAKFLGGSLDDEPSAKSSKKKKKKKNRDI